MSNWGTELPLLLLAVAAPLGAIDVLYYHLFRFRLFERRASWAETGTHLARGLFIASAAWMMGSYELHGAWFWAMVVLFVADFLNNAVDVALEPAARKEFGGLPPLEYAIHVLGASLSGAVGAAYVAGHASQQALSTALLPVTNAGWLAWNAKFVAMGGALLVLAEGALMVRAMLRSKDKDTANVVALAAG